MLKKFYVMDHQFPPSFSPVKTRRKGNKFGRLVTVLLGEISVPLPCPVPFGDCLQEPNLVVLLARPCPVPPELLGARNAWVRPALLPPAGGKLAGPKASTLGTFSASWKPSPPPSHSAAPSPPAPGPYVPSWKRSSPETRAFGLPSPTSLAPVGERRG